jgi:hypothetical protein
LITTLLLPRPGKSLVLPGDAGTVADPKIYDLDSTTVMASGVIAALLEHRYRATFIVPLDTFNFDGVSRAEPNSVVAKGHDVISALDASLKGKVRIDFLKPLEGNRNKDSMVAQLTFTQKSSAAFFKLMLGGRA